MSDLIKIAISLKDKVASCNVQEQKIHVLNIDILNTSTHEAYIAQPATSAQAPPNVEDTFENPNQVIELPISSIADYERNNELLEETILEDALVSTSILYTY